MACKLGDLVDFITMQLNDAFNKAGLPVEPGEVSNKRWSRPLIIQYIANAVVASQIADLQSQTNKGTEKEITLDPGCVQNVCDDGCDAFGGFVKIVGSDGCDPDFEEKEIPPRFKKALKRFQDMECLTGEQEEIPYHPGKVTADTINPCLFYVENPAPEEETKMLINCITYPNAEDIINGGEDYELPPEACGRLRPAIYEYVMHQAWELDLEIDKRVSRTRQKEHMDNFLVFVKLSNSAWKELQKNLKEREEDD